MNKLTNWQKKIEEKRKQTPWREFVKQIASRQPNVFYKVNGLVSRFPESDRIGNVVKYSQYYEQEWNSYINGHPYDPSRPFFEQWKELWMNVDATNMINFFMSENSDYGDVVSKSRNVYLSTYVVNGNEDVVYSYGVKDNCSRIFNSSIISDGCENIYNSLGVSHSFEIIYSRYIANSSHIWFSTNLQGCSHCLFCNGLENKSYCISNKQYSKEEYLELKQQYLSEKGKFHDYYEQICRIPSQHVASSNVSGHYAIESHDVENAYFPYRVNTWRNLINVGGSEGNTDIYDVVNGGWPELHNICGVNGIAINTQYAYLSCHIPNCHNVYYCFYSESCSYCLWCIGLKNKEYCIFNKQYSREERHQKVNEIFENMEQSGEFGEFFPSSINPFYFNDTVAALIEDFDRDEIVGDWYMRRDEEIKVDIPEWMDVVSHSELSSFEQTVDANYTIDESILKKVIRDEEWHNYRIIKMEYDFLIKYWLPLPRAHWFKRLKEHFRK